MATTTTNLTVQKEQKAFVQPQATPEIQLTPQQKFEEGFGWDPAEFMDNEVAQRQSVSGSIDFNKVATEAVTDLTRVSIKTAENVGSLAMDVAGETAGIFKFILTGNPESITYSTAENNPAKVGGEQMTEQKAEQIKKENDYMQIRQIHETIELKITQVSMEVLQEQIVRILQNGAALSEQQKRARLNIQGSNVKLEAYHYVELRAALIEDEQSQEKAQKQQSIAQTSKTNVILDGIVEGGNAGGKLNISTTGGGGVG